MHCGGWLIVALAGLLGTTPAGAEAVTLCYHYGCDHSSRIELGDDMLYWFSQRLRDSDDAAAERAALQDVALAFYQYAAQTAPIASDLGGNNEDAANVGRMDCLDHSHNMHVLLQILTAHGYLQHHQLVGLVHRAPLLFNYHSAVAIHDLSSNTDWVIDSWFRDFGAPPVVVPLAIWKEGFSP